MKWARSRTTSQEPPKKPFPLPKESLILIWSSCRSRANTWRSPINTIRWLQLGVLVAPSTPKRPAKRPYHWHFECSNSHYQLIFVILGATVASKRNHKSSRNQPRKVQTPLVLGLSVWGVFWKPSENSESLKKTLNMCDNLQKAMIRSLNLPPKNIINTSKSWKNERTEPLGCLCGPKSSSFCRGQNSLGGVSEDLPSPRAAPFWERRQSNWPFLEEVQTTSYSLGCWLTDSFALLVVLFVR